MNCQEISQKLDALIDGELPESERIQIEEHIHSCPQCVEERNVLTTLGRSLSTSSLRYSAPSGLKAAILEEIAGEQVQEKAPRQNWFSSLFGSNNYAWAAVAALIIGIAAVLSTSIFFSPRNSDALNTSREVVSSHIRSLMGDHLADVISTDQHTVKPWFEGKLDFGPSVEDLKTQGFPLIGGRLDYINEQTAAALVYKKDKHVINLFELKSKENSRPENTYEYHGYTIINWTNKGITNWAVSDCSGKDLQRFVDLLKNS